MDELQDLKIMLPCADGDPTPTPAPSQGYSSSSCSKSCPAIFDATPHTPLPVTPRLTLTLTLTLTKAGSPRWSGTRTRYSTSSSSSVASSTCSACRCSHCGKALGSNPRLDASLALTLTLILSPKVQAPAEAAAPRCRREGSQRGFLEGADLRARHRAEPRQVRAVRPARPTLSREVSW